MPETLSPNSIAWQVTALFRPKFFRPGFVFYNPTADIWPSSFHSRKSQSSPFLFLALEHHLCQVNINSCNIPWENSNHRIDRAGNSPVLRCKRRSKAPFLRRPNFLLAYLQHTSQKPAMHGLTALLGQLPRFFNPKFFVPVSHGAVRIFCCSLSLPIIAIKPGRKFISSVFAMSKFVLVHHVKMDVLQGTAVCACVPPLQFLHTG